MIRARRRHLAFSVPCRDSPYTAPHHYAGPAQPAEHPPRRREPPDPPHPPERGQCGVPVRLGLPGDGLALSERPRVPGRPHVCVRRCGQSQQRRRVVCPYRRTSVLQGLDTPPSCGMQATCATCCSKSPTKWYTWEMNVSPDRLRHRLSPYPSRRHPRSPSAHYLHVRSPGLALHRDHDSRDPRAYR
jgi:hypothetical protein